LWLAIVLPEAPLFHITDAAERVRRTKLVSALKVTLMCLFTPPKERLEEPLSPVLHKDETPVGGNSSRKKIKISPESKAQESSLSEKGV